MSDVQLPSDGSHLGAKAKMGLSDDELTTNGGQCFKESSVQEEMEMDKVCQSDGDTIEIEGAVAKNETEQQTKIKSSHKKREKGNVSPSSTKEENSCELNSVEESMSVTNESKHVPKNLIDEETVQVPEEDGAVAATKSVKSASKENSSLVKPDLEKSEAKNSKQEKCDMPTENRSPINTEEKDKSEAKNSKQEKCDMSLEKRRNKSPINTEEKDKSEAKNSKQEKCDMSTEKRRNRSPINTEEKDLSKLNGENMETVSETKHNTENLKGIKTIQVGKWTLHFIPVGTVRDNCDKKTILLLGSSGSGKSTLVRFIASCSMNIDVSDQDLLRTKLSVIDENMERNGSDVTAYEFYPDEEGKEAITVIDTPGLNDTSERTDSQHIRNIDSILKMTVSQEIEIHAIGFVIQSHVSRMTASDKVIIDYITKYIKESSIPNIIPLVTFADNEKTPPVIRTLQDYPLDIKQFFIFNNSFLCSEENQENEEMDELYRRRGHRQWKKLTKMMKLMTPMEFILQERGDETDDSKEQKERKYHNKEKTENAKVKEADATADLQKSVEEFLTAVNAKNWNQEDIDNHRESVWSKVPAAYRVSHRKQTSVDTWLYDFVLSISSQRKNRYDLPLYLQILSLAKSKSLIHVSRGILMNAQSNYDTFEYAVEGSRWKYFSRPTLKSLENEMLGKTVLSIRKLLREEKVDDIMTVHDLFEMFRSETGWSYMSKQLFHRLNAIAN